MIDLQFAITVLRDIGAFGGLIPLVKSAQHMFHFFKPLKIAPRSTLVFDGSALDEISVDITNVGSQDQVIVRCSIRGANSIKGALIKHITRPLTRPSLYSNIWYGPTRLSIFDNDFRLKPKDRKSFSRELSLQPLSLLISPCYLIEVELSNGRVLRSKRMPVPRRWHIETLIY